MPRLLTIRQRRRRDPRTTVRPAGSALRAGPFERERFPVKDGRNATLNNSAFGTVYGVAGDKPMPVCDYAGFAPFGFGYRRCPGEQLTINVFEDFLRKVWKERIEFVKLNIANPAPVPLPDDRDCRQGRSRAQRGHSLSSTPPARPQNPHSTRRPDRRLPLAGSFPGGFRRRPSMCRLVAIGRHLKPFFCGVPAQ